MPDSNNNSPLEPNRAQDNQNQNRPFFITPKQVNVARGQEGRSKSDRPLFVYASGMDGTGQLLHTQTAGLEQGFEVRCLALPPWNHDDWDSLATALVELVWAELGKARPGSPLRRSVYLCGESFGGCLALRTAVKAPELFTHIVLINPASSYHRRPWLYWLGQLSNYTPDSLYRTAALGLLPFLSNPSRILTANRRALLDAMRMVPVQTASWRMSLLYNFRISPEELAQLTQPVLLIAGGADRLLPSVTEVQWLHEQLPNSKALVLPQCGHACLLEETVNLYEILKQQEFLAPEAQPAAVE
ncbi:alpha/beta fold hydrolase [Leptolyngbya sp. FACHB-261]|uniref:alpha/beta fold hydrolase n=1 Tax=Leptolyngbya sp. FACHB-261 TaxID=2692806 RepID=UPI001682FF84|nr:alpha/beta hydrolase [Leptolyngbya sp. FACHB-261]MBD2102880.1 alpha/beta hydrolase [Leptolyngbya sp. FACHB-261]